MKYSTLFCRILNSCEVSVNFLELLNATEYSVHFKNLFAETDTNETKAQLELNRRQKLPFGRRKKFLPVSLSSRHQNYINYSLELHAACMPIGRVGLFPVKRHGSSWKRKLFLSGCAPRDEITRPQSPFAKDGTVSRVFRGGMTWYAAAHTLSFVPFRCTLHAHVRAFTNNETKCAIVRHGALPTKFFEAFPDP